MTHRYRPQTGARARAAVVSQAERTGPVRLLIGGLALVAALLWSVSAVLARPAPDSFADLVEGLSPAVVNISTTQRVGGEAGGMGRGQGPGAGPGDSPFDEFFREFFGDRLPRGGEREVRSLGSGFVIDPSGYIVTNNHVVGEATGIQVTFSNDLVLDATVVGNDEATDLAVIKVNHDEPLPHVSFGNSDTARVGDWVMAIGNPFGLGGSVSAGIVSARNRNIGAGRYDDFIQTDAAINRGNSGGPLFNTAGEVIGVNTVIITPTGASVGVGFAISSALARGVVDQLIEFGETRRGWLGVQIQRVNEDIAESFGLADAKGAVVSGVSQGSPAAAGGVQMGDVILSFDGETVGNERDLSRIVAGTPIGKSVSVVVWREGARRTLSVEIGELNEEKLANFRPVGASGGESGAERELTNLGVTLSELDERLRDRFDVSESITGVLVTEVDPDGPASGQLYRGDVIVQVQQTDVTAPSEVEDKLTSRNTASEKPVLFLVNRGGQLTFVAFRPEDG